MTKDEMNKKLLQQANSLTSTVDSLNATINAQTQLIAQLNQTIQELKEQLNKNSKNSPKRGNAGMEQCGVLPEFKGIAIFMQLFLVALDKIIFRDYNYNSVIYQCYIGGVQNKRKWNDFRKYPPGSESRIFRKRI